VSNIEWCKACDKATPHHSEFWPLSSGSAHLQRVCDVCGEATCTVCRGDTPWNKPPCPAKPPTKGVTLYG
jgi:hypothetical protein